MFIPNLASTAALLTDLAGTTRTCRWTETDLKSFNQCKELINYIAVIKPWHNTSAVAKYVIRNTSDIVLGSWLEQGTVDRIRPVRFNYRNFNPAQLSYATLQKELLAIIDLLKFFKAQLWGTKFTILTDHKALETFLDKTEVSQKRRGWQDFLESFAQTIVHSAHKQNSMADAINENYICIGTVTEEEDFIAESLDNTTLHQTPTLPTPPNTLTCNHFSIPHFWS